MLGRWWNGTCVSHAHGLGAHRRWCLGAVLCIASSACSDDGASPRLNVDAGSSTAGSMDAGTVAPAPGSDAGAAPVTQDAGASASPAADAGPGAADSGAQSQTPVDAGMDASTAQPALDSGSDAAAATDGGSNGDAGGDGGSNGDSGTDGGSGGDAGSDAGTAAIDYKLPGPYKVVIEKNAGQAFRNTVDDDTLLCNLFIGLLGGENPDVDKELTTYPSDMQRGLYTVFRPDPLEAGKKYPVLTWGNGTCSHPLLFDELLTHVASHGFIVVASNSRWVGDGTVMLRGVDFMLSEANRSGGPYFGKIETAMIGAFGHSQGSLATVTAAADARIVASVPIMGVSADAITKVKGPTFLIAGEKDTLIAPATVKESFDASTVPTAYGLALGQDHLMPGRDAAKIWDAVTAWFKIHLSKDTQARALFYGDACTLCSDPRWKLERKNLLP